MFDIPKFIFVIDTTDYAGNFERELCAYVTGQIGDCGAGHDLREVALEEQPRLDEIFEDTVKQYHDDHGCWRPCQIWPNKKGKYNSVAIFFFERPTEEQIEIIKVRAAKFVKEIKSKYIDMSQIKKILGFRLIESTVVYNEISY